MASLPNAGQSKNALCDASENINQPTPLMLFEIAIVRSSYIQKEGEKY